MMNMTQKKIVVIYHGGCSDGFGGAWAAWKKFGKRATYAGIVHGRTPPRLADRDIFFIDIVYPAQTMRKLMRRNRVTVIDHHESERHIAESAHAHSYDVDHSGAVLAWRYFHPRRPVPRLLRHIEDIDLWRFCMPHTKAIDAFLALHKMTFPEWNKLAALIERPDTRRRCVEKGKLILRYEERRIQEIISEASQLVRFAGHEVFAVNSPHFTNDLARTLIRKRPPFAIVWRVCRDDIRVSLRGDDSVDLAKIAVRFGGGGHRSASGFRLPLGARLPWRSVQK